MQVDETDVITCVMFLLDDQTASLSGDAFIHVFIKAYSATYSDWKWFRTRWFLSLPCGELEELKLQSNRPRTAWFLQRFPVEPGAMRE